jgi:Kdo2-lipid IVA lauroyltransferase/acyltransferase
MRVLYWISNALYFLLFYIIGYRKKVVYFNLKLSFPEKSEYELTIIQKEFFRHLADLIVESVKSFSISKEEILSRVKLPTDFISNDFGEDRSIILLLGHMGNWEWAGLGASAITPFRMHIVYHQLSNPEFDSLMYNTRSKFGAELSKMEDTLRSMIRLKDRPTATCLVADQNPSPENAYWIDFLNRKTAFFRGPFKLAYKFKQPCYYVGIEKTKRGQYQLKPILISSKDREMTEDELMEAYVRSLEIDIKENPAYWLWSHRRWKHKHEDYIKAD